MANTYTCPKHPELNEQDDWCPACITAFETRTPVEEMSIEERLAEFESMYDILTMPFSNLHQRFEELCGRPVWTHELVDRDGLRNEVIGFGSGDGPADALTAMIERLPTNKPVIMVETD